MESVLFLTKRNGHVFKFCLTPCRRMGFSIKFETFKSGWSMDQARGRLGQNSRPRGQNFTLNGTQREVGVSLIIFFFFFFFRETHFHSVTTQMQAVMT